MSVCSWIPETSLQTSKKSIEQKKNKGSVLVAESAYNAQNVQFGLVMIKVFIKEFKFIKKIF